LKLRKVFRFRMKPDAAQREALARMAGARRSVWNWALAGRQEHYRETGNTLPQSELSRRLPALKREPGTAWLEAVDSQALQQALAGLERAFVNFFKKRARFRIRRRVRLADGKVYVPKAGFIRIRQSQPVEDLSCRRHRKRFAFTLPGEGNHI
jgi:putative transposase